MSSGIECRDLVGPQRGNLRRAQRSHLIGRQDLDLFGTQAKRTWLVVRAATCCVLSADI